MRTVVKPCSLDPATQNLITNIFSKEMFKNAMTLMNLGEEELSAGCGSPPPPISGATGLSSSFHTPPPQM